MHKSLPVLVGGDGDGDPAVLALAAVHALHHVRVAVAVAFLHPRELQPDVLEALPGLRAEKRQQLAQCSERWADEFNKEVAAVLTISIRTAETHKARMLKALGVRTTAELVQYAIRNGIISL